MDSAQSILDTLRTVEFRLGLKGYNVDEVDEYLEKAAAEAEVVREQIRLLNERLRLANERITQLEGAGPPPPQVAATDDSASEALQRTLLLAQRFVDQTKRESEAEATSVVEGAEERARILVTQAEERARQLSSEAEHRLREEVTRLEGLRTHLSGEVEALARHLETERTRIRSSLTDVLKWLDERVQPGVTRTKAEPDAPRRLPEPALPLESPRPPERAAARVGEAVEGR